MIIKNSNVLPRLDERSMILSQRGMSADLISQLTFVDVAVTEVGISRSVNASWYVIIHNSHKNFHDFGVLRKGISWSGGPLALRRQEQPWI